MKDHLAYLIKHVHHLPNLNLEYPLISTVLNLAFNLMSYMSFECSFFALNTFNEMHTYSCYPKVCSYVDGRDTS